MAIRRRSGWRLIWKKKKHFSHLFLRGKEEILRVIRSRYLKQVKITHGKMFIQRQGKVIFLMWMKIYICRRRRQRGMYVCISQGIQQMRQMIRQIGSQFLFMTSRSMQMRFLIRFSRMKTTVWKEQQKQAILKRFKASRENKVRQKRLTEI